MRTITAILFSVILFSSMSIITTNQSFGDTQICKSGFELIFKASTNLPACVKPTTAEKLIERGWGVAIPNQTSDSEKQTEHIISDTAGLTKLVNANNQFAISFYSQISKDNNNANIFFSPWSISTAFALVYEGANSITSEEIENAFGFIQDDTERRSTFTSMQNNLNEKDSKYKLQVANALWLAQDFEPLPEYVNTAQMYYGSEVNKVNFITDEGVHTINEWVKSKTEEKIEKIFQPGSTDETTRLAITNAIYFKGTWINPFDKDRTTELDFQVNSDKTVKVPMMYLSKTSLNHMRTDQLEILELPYEDDKLSMLILLPNNVNGIKSLEESLTTENLTLWKTKLSETSMLVWMPKFTLATDYNLKNELRNLGLSSAFNPNTADFSGITELEKLFVQQAVHKAFVDVNEEGTEAAAATGIGIGVTSAPPTFIADHPFIFIIQEKETGNILFIGKIADPTSL